MAAALSKDLDPKDGFLKIEKGAIRLELRLTPKAKKTALTGQANDAEGRAYLKASVTAVPKNGKANSALIKLLSKEWKIAKSQIKIIRGQTNTRKTIEITGEIDKVRPQIMTWLNKRPF